MPFDAVLFDLDGTLLDTYEDIADSLNAALAVLDRPALPASLVKQYIGGGVELLVQRALETDEPAVVSRFAARFRQEYAERWACKTRPFEGVLELLDTLAQRGIRLGVFSNKPDQFTRQCVSRFLPEKKIAVVAGAQAGVPRKPDPTGARLVAQELQAEPAAILYLGDTPTDMETAVAAGMCAVGATWGYRSAEDLLAHGAATLIDHPHELLALLD